MKPPYPHNPKPSAIYPAGGFGYYAEFKKEILHLESKPAGPRKAGLHFSPVGLAAYSSPVSQ